MKNGRVLLADRNLNMLGGVYSLLDTLFDTVLMVADERSLMQAIAEFEPCLVVVDLSLPDSGEVNIVKRLMQKHPELRLVVLSVDDDATVAAHVRSAGAVGFVLKRTAATELVPAVLAVLRGDRYVSAVCESDPGMPGAGASALGSAKQS